MFIKVSERIRKYEASPGVYLAFACMTLASLCFAASVIVFMQHAWVRAFEAVDLVKPFMGTEMGGNMFPGVTLPFGAVKIGIDVATYPGSGDPYSGYLPRGNVTGFSMMHESGTGGAPKYGTVSQMPIVGKVDNPLENYSVPRRKNKADKAEVGWYTAHLSNGVDVELATARHSGMIRHTFVEASAQQDKNVLVDVSHFLPSNRGLGIEQHYVGGEIKLETDGRYTGYGIYNGGWNYAPDWKIHFCGRFDTTPSRAATFIGTDETLEAFGQTRTVSATGKRVGALFTWTQSQPSTSNTRIRKRQRTVAPLIIESRIGVSWVSVENACAFMTTEIQKQNAFSSLVQTAKSAWTSEILGKFKTTETNQEMLSLLYTSLYGMFLIPSDRSADNTLLGNSNSTEPYYDDIFTLWDTFRSHTPLFHILSPSRYRDFLRSLLRIYQSAGFLPDGRSSNFNGRIQGGTNADNVLADAYVKGVTGVDWNLAWKAVINNAETVPPNNNDSQANDSSTQHGRGALQDWNKFGHITMKFSRSVSRASEYAANDFAISQLARGLNKSKDTIGKYSNRSRNWRNHWDTRMSAHGFTGFLSPLTTSHSFPNPPQNPLSCNGCYWGDAYYQGLPYEYSFNAHHDMPHLISLMGGDAQFIARLTKIFEPNSHPNGDPRFDKTIFNPGNEPGFASPYLFNFVPGEQWRSVEASRKVARSYYNSDARGLPGNSDAGAMQSWLLWTMIGLYPITGTDVFLISSPRLRDLKIELGGGRVFEVVCEGGGEENGEWFVQSLRVNGQEWTKGWVRWADVFKDGGRMEFVLGKEKTKWESSGERPLWNV